MRGGDIWTDHFGKPRLNQGDLEMQCCSIDNMTADYMTKALQGTKCELMRYKILNIPVDPEDNGNRNMELKVKRKKVRIGGTEGIIINPQQMMFSDKLNICHKSQR